MKETPRQRREREKLEEENRQFMRQHHFIASLVDLEVESPLSPENHEAVIRLCITHGIDNFQFLDIDSKPGKWGYEYTGLSGDRGEWHYKLRQVRNNPDNDLFDILNYIRMDRGDKVEGGKLVGLSPSGVVWIERSGKPENFETQCKAFDEQFADKFYTGNED